jgi:two-component system sensor histidine kinase/response regulator
MFFSRRLNILVVDDNLINQKLACRLLEKQGHSVMVANNGQEALKTLEDSQFDLVLMDIQMPEMDGIAATETIRASEAGKPCRLPIVALTAHATEDDRQRCLQAGMDGYVTKPIQPPALFQVMADALGDRLAEA